MINLAEHKNIHCIGIGGIGLSAIAEILKSKGFRVSGSDINSSSITRKLEEKGIKVYYTQEEKNIDDIDLVIYSAAIGKDNPERKKAEKDGIVSLSRAEILGILMEKFKESIAVSGTHGKTTTTSMISEILLEGNKEPTILVGGELESILGNVKTGDSDYFITEACEYKDSFLYFKPKMEVILNIDEDHMDYFKDIEDIKKSFGLFMGNTKEDGFVVANIDDENIKTLIENRKNIVTFGRSEDAVYKIKDIEFNEFGNGSYEIEKEGKSLGKVHLNLPGEYNVYNSAAAFVLTYELGIPKEIILKSLGKFKGAGRRFELKGKLEGNVFLIDDYAHHPTEIRETLTATKNMKKNNIWCIFQSHTYTRTLTLLDDFAKALTIADKIVVADIFAAREKNEENITGQKIADKILEFEPKKEVLYIDDFDKIAGYILENIEPEDIILTMGAGDIYKVGYKMLEKSGKK